MSLKFTESQDGVERATVLVPLRLSREDIAAVKRLAKKDGCPWRAWLEDQAALGVEGALMHEDRDGEYEQRYGKGEGD